MKVLFSIAVAWTLCCGFGGIAAADDFPARRITMIVPFAAGGTADIVARLVAQRLSRNWDVPVIVDNRPGATGTVAAMLVKQSAPDGYTLLIGGGSVNTIPEVFRSDLPYKTLTDFAPVTKLAVLPNLLVLNPSVPAHSVRELVTLLKTRPGELNFGSAGVGSSGHLAGELFALATQTTMVHVPYNGSAPAVTDLLAGHIQLMFDNMPTVLPLVKDGQLVALGVTSAERVAAEPDIPAIAEAIPGYEATSWVGLLAPAGTANAIVEKISAAVGEIVRQPDVAGRLQGLGAAPDADSPVDFSRFLTAELQKWRGVVTKAGIAAP